MTLILILGLATMRVTRLWRDDTITSGLRSVVLGWLDDHAEKRGRLSAMWDWLLELLDCPWCISGWIAAAAVVLVDSATSRSVPLPAAAWFASWAVAVAVYWIVDLAFEASRLLHHIGKAKGAVPDDE